MSVQGRVWAFPASYGQERIWLAEQSRPGSTVFAVGLVFPLPPGTDEDAATAALTAVVARHEPLRTSLRAVGGRLEQLVHPGVPVALACTDLGQVPASQAQALVHRSCQEDMAPPFDLEQAPLWRARLLLLGGGERVLTLVAHHTVCDGQSWQVLKAELSELCLARAESRPPRLARLRLQYADWAVWQREHQLTPAAAHRELDHWRARLVGLPAVTAVPTDRPRTPDVDDAGGEVFFAIPQAVADRVTGCARRWRVTEFAVLFAAWAALLARLGDDPDVAMGVPVSGRSEPDLAGLVGMFVNTVVLRVDMSADPSFEALTRQAADVALEAMEHGDVPFQQVVSALAQARGGGAEGAGGPALLPQVGFNLLQGTPLQRGYGTAREDLLLELAGRSGRLEYRTALFDDSTAREIADRFLRVLRAATLDPAVPVSRLPLVDASEQARLDVLGTSTDPDHTAAVPAGALLPDLVLARAARVPDAIAVRDGDTVVTYRDLAQRGRRLAGRLTAAGVGPERLVAVLLPRSADHVVTVLGVLLAGGAHLPLDPDQPLERLASLLASSGAGVLVTRDGVPPGLAVPGVRIIDMSQDAGPAATPQAGVGPDRTPAGPSHLAYVLHTSGSTGTPKGVAIEHRSLTGYVRWFVERCALGPQDRVLAVTSPTFDACVNELFPVLVTGGTIVVAPPCHAGDPRRLADLVVEHAITLLPLVPSTLAEWVASGQLARCTSVRQVVCGGERLSGHLHRALVQQLPVPLHNIYGPTETTVGVTAFRALPTDHHAAAVPIGRPVAGARIRLLDARGGPVPVGVPGQVHVGGPPVGRGYPRHPGLTAERFVPDPFGPPGSRLYRTGDRARWLPDGHLEFLGRLDEQVKVRGVRVEPGEVETAVRSLRGVLQAAVVLREDAPGGPGLVAYLVPAAGTHEQAGWRAALARVLPRHLLPAALVPLPALPTTAAGKLDRAALPPPGEAGRSTAGAAPELPRTAVERLVAEVWEQVLGVPGIAAHDRFLDLGGHSLLAVRVVTLLSDLLDVEVPVHLVLADGGVTELAGAIEALVVADAVPPRPDAAAGARAARAVEEVGQG